MGADRALVEGAYRAAMAKVPGDYSQFYWKEAIGTQQALTDLVESGVSAIEALREATKKREEDRKKKEDAQWNEFSKIMDAAGKKFSSYERGGKEESLHEDLYNLYLDGSSDLAARYEAVNTVGKKDTAENKKERQAIWGELNAFVNELKGLGTNILTIAEMNNGKLLSKEGMGGAKQMYVIGEIVNQDKDWSNVKLSRTKEEGLTFEVDASGYVDPLTGENAGWGK